MAEPSLELLQTMVQRVLDDTDALRRDNREIKQRLGTLERQMGSFASIEAEHYASLSVRLDNIDARTERIERRLSLIDAT